MSCRLTCNDVSVGVVEKVDNSQDDHSDHSTYSSADHHSSLTDHILYQQLGLPGPRPLTAQS